MRHHRLPLLILLLGAFAVLTTNAAAAPPVEFADDFRNYASGGAGEPQWEPLDIGFRVQRGAMQAEVHDRRGMTVLKAVPPGRALTLEASVTPLQTLGKQWKTAGIGLFLDGNNYWHVALVESPDGQQRFAELSEMLDGEWNAQMAPGTELTQVEESGSGKWHPGKPYRLRLTLTRGDEGGRITGEVFEGGKPLYRCVRMLDARAVDCGRPMLTAGSVAVHFDDVRVKVIEALPAETGQDRAKRFPPFESSALTVKGAPGRATGYFRTEAEGKTWWLVDPSGRRTLSLGTDHVRYGGLWCEALGYAPYGRNVAKRYGSPEAWAHEATRRLRAWNFNVLGAGHSDQTRHRGLAHTEHLLFGTDFSDIAALVEKTTWTGWPDVFDERFERFCELRARERCGPNRDDPWLLGYFLDNELEWWGKQGDPWGIATEACKLPASAAGKRALVAVLQQAFGNDIAAFNADFGCQLRGFDEILSWSTLPPPKSDRARDGLAAFVAEAAKRYFQITTAAVRRHDPNHLILGCRFAHDAPESAWRQAGATCDVVTVNVYPRIDLAAERVLGMEQHLRSRFALCGKPILITEWSFPALDARDSTGRPLPSQHGAGMRVDTQAQRARCYAIMQRTLCSLPFVVGSHYFMWSDDPALGVSSTFREDSNYGLVNDADEPYPALTETARRVNRLMPELHAGVIQPADVAAGSVAADEVPALAIEPGELRFTRKGDGFVIANGALRLERNATGGAAFDRIERKEAGSEWIELGSYYPVVFVAERGQKFWSRAERVTAVEVREQTPRRLVLEMHFAHAAPAWTAAYRFSFEPGLPYFLAQALWVENAGSQPWRLRGYYHYIPSCIGGDARDDEPAGLHVQSYYLPVAAWRDARTPWHFGLLAPRLDEERLELRFWKEGEQQHPDGWRKLDTELAPGTRWQAEGDEPVVAVFGLRVTPEVPRPWLSVLRTIHESESRAALRSQ